MASVSMSAGDFAAVLRERFPSAIVSVAQPRGEIGLIIDAATWDADCRALRDALGFEQMVDLCGMDYLGYGSDEWDTDISSQGYSRGVEGRGAGRFKFGETTSRQMPEPQGQGDIPQPRQRFAVVVQLLSVQHNRRVRLTCFAPDDSLPIVPSITAIWPIANWFEREAFDLFGIIFEGHPDLRRILTDYGFVGHPFRKDFPLIGNVEVRYDADNKRVVYEPVTSVEPRVLVPRVVRNDSRYATERGAEANDAAMRAAVESGK